MQTLPITVLDNTLRDGEQQAGLFFSTTTKYELAHLIWKTGVRYIDIMPCVCEEEAELAKTLASQGLMMSAATLMGKSYIDLAQNCGLKNIVMFKGLSDRLLFLRDAEIRQMPEFQGKTIDDGIPKTVINQIRHRALEQIVEHLRYAVEETEMEVFFAIEDASRADFDFLVECLQAFSPYIEYCVLCDTVGVLTPEKSYTWIQNLLHSTKGVKLGVHYHNDLGLALENTLQSIMGGASLISGTFNGIGERSGNVALEQVLNGLRLRFGIEVEGFNYEAIAPVLAYMNERGIRPEPPYSPKAQYHESGIHVNSLLADPKSYAVLPYNTVDILFGKWSGASNFRYLFEKELQHPQTPEQYDKMRTVIKTLAIEQQRYFTANEVVEFWENGIFK